MITQINAILEIYFRRDLSETDARLPDLLALNAHFSTMLTSQGTKFSFMDFIRDDKSDKFRKSNGDHYSRVSEVICA